MLEASAAQAGVPLAHGGGHLPHYFGRLDRNVKAHPHSAVNISRRPSEYLRDLYYDTCVYEPTVLEALVARVGADRSGLRVADGRTVTHAHTTPTEDHAGT